MQAFRRRVIAMKLAPPARKSHGGFTLLELLVVVAIMAVVAGSVVMVLGRTEEQANVHITQSEITELKKAYLRFRKDTGYFPKQGPFALSPSGLIKPDDPSHWPTFLSGKSPQERATWFHSPANHYQLLGLIYAVPDNQGPLAGTGHPLRTFDPDTARGWNGPYLGRAGNGFLRIGSALNPDGSGSPVAGTPIKDVVGVADPFALPPVGSEAHLQWRPQPNGPATEYARWGRPYFAFGLHDPNQARLVGTGPNGTYGDQDDLTLYLLR